MTGAKVGSSAIDLVARGSMIETPLGLSACAGLIKEALVSWTK
jgi:hypothetical protein